MIIVDQQARQVGNKFISEFNPRSNHRNKFIEWTDEQIRTAGGKLEGWPEGKIKEALPNYMNGRQNAQTLEYWFRSMCSVFL